MAAGVMEWPLPSGLKVSGEQFTPPDAKISPAVGTKRASQEHSF